VNPTSVPTELDATAFENIEPIFQELLEREILSTPDLERWLLDRSELAAACSESGANLYITMTCDTNDTAAAGAYRDFIEQVLPKIKPLDFALDQRQVELTARFDLDSDRYAVLMRDTEADVALFREENVPLETKLDTLSQDYQTITGAMTVTFKGQEQTMPQMARYQEDSDRAKREAAWRASADRRLSDVDPLNTIFDEMVSLRHTLSVNAGVDDYIGYTFKAKHRFDYTPSDCHSFHDACERFVAPFSMRRGEERCKALGVQTLRPWDVVVDPLGREPLKPFDGGADLVTKSASAFARLDPRLAEMFATLGEGATAQGSRGGAKLDLDSRKGKAPGGYQYMRDRIREPFIFMNAAGLHRDVETMVHEAGHAFHSILCRDEPLLQYRHSTIEFAEVASMSMELLSMPYWGGTSDSFYPDEADAARAKRRQLEGSITMLGWIATIDAFQHWIYANPTHTQDERAAHWRSLVERFGAMGHFVSWDGLENHCDSFWQRQSHLFSVPFYYIEYGIAQLGAMQLWLRSLEEGEEAVIASYMKALRLGGSVPLPDLFEAAGLEFNFGPSMVERIVTRVEAELAKLPA
jgi:oligoendopeptidase F